MKKQLTTIILTATLSALIGSVPLSAQDGTSEVATIPFSFQAQGTTMPAGNYHVSEFTAQSPVYKLTSDKGKSIYWMAPSENKADPAKPELTFVHSGSEYVLASLSMPGSSVSHGVSEAVISKSLSRSMGISSLVAVPLRAR
ncbi:MAG: hypothetical protein JO270_03280 [Acidobacteriaceae bacterium]|nr:hypothetical protein [Acidobacteriaceae bacterium]MBV8572467.1 hypothetical protein [Acidobacteriaceae bacterium]